ncbi:cation:proton antiporter [Svornostia abyssi]|uniref:Cation:proton antiporter n=1 Tax=Svornostia abyssi TaxID=2898438 RepID=A0ABY5PB08_9ACTN|nr:cation:proton antiporter [Parviterribacteraceae bacterium J379]
MIEVDGTSFLVVVGVALVAAVLSARLARWLPLPVVVLELILGIIVGPEVLGLAAPDDFIEFFASLGLGMLFFFAGYEIDLERIRGVPLKLAAVGWIISLALAYAIGGILAALGIVISLLFVGTAMSTTAIGTLIPILSDAGEMKTRFGTFLLAAGAIGEFGPILLITLFFSATSPVTSALLLFAFVVIAVVTAVVATRSVVTGWDAIERTLETSGQIAIRGSVFVVFALAALASELGLDLLLGGFVAGIIVRLALKGREVPVFESKLTAVGYGFLIPFFFVTSGLNFDIAALVEDPVNLLKVVMFLALFLVVRGTPAMLLYRKVFDARDRMALAFFSATQLPLVVAITTIAVEQKEMRSSTSASLVGAAILSTMIFPLVGLKLRGDRSSAAAAEPGWAPS